MITDSEVDSLIESKHIEESDWLKEYGDDTRQTWLKGELAFEKLTGLKMNKGNTVHGDGGRDFSLTITIDVKTAKKPKYLIVEVGTVKADMYILQGIKADDSVYLIGWAWGYEIRQAPSRDFGYGKINHYIPADLLKPINQIMNLVEKLNWNKNSGIDNKIS